MFIVEHRDMVVWMARKISSLLFALEHSTTLAGELRSSLRTLRSDKTWRQLFHDAQTESCFRANTAVERL
jgi:hypothetical protein